MAYNGPIFTFILGVYQIFPAYLECRIWNAEDISHWENSLDEKVIKSHLTAFGGLNIGFLSELNACDSDNSDDDKNGTYEIFAKHRFTETYK